MKNFLLFFVLLLVVSLKAQTNDGVLGFKGGVNFSTFTGYEDSNLFEVSRRTSFHVGLMIETKISTNVFLQPEIVLSSQGSNVESGSEDLENRLNYVNLPMLIKFYVSDGFSCDIGPQIGVLFSAKQSSSSRNDTDVKVNFNDFDVGIVAGISYKFLSGINISARYNFGLKNIVNTNLFSEQEKLKNSVFQLSIGYYLKNRN